jgi:hypothetical protein
MALRIDVNWRRGVAAALLAALLLTAGLPRANPQEKPESIVHYANKLSFFIPFTPEKDAHRITQVLLYYSEDNGKTFRYYASAGPGEKGFTFTARGDGTYWFAVQTKDVNGNYNPTQEALSQNPPGLKVVVDTKPPLVTLQEIPDVHDGQVGVEWTLSDDNLDVGTMHLDYRAAGARDWYPVDSVQKAVHSKHTWKPLVGGKLEVRLQVRDKANNTGEKTITLTAPGAGATGSGPGTVSGMGTGAEGTPGQPRPYFVNSKHFRLHSQVENIGKSKVKKIEVWVTYNGVNWKTPPQIAEIKDGAPPPYAVEVSVPEDGRYGITLVAVSGVGLAEPRPKEGDPPQVWIEVDETKPKVQITTIDVGKGADHGKLTIKWTATDKNMADQPITLSYGTSADGPWSPIKQDLPNEGRFVWQMPTDLPVEFFLRVEAKDKANNVGSDTTKTPVAVDLSIPKTIIQGVEPLPPSASGTGAAPTIAPPVPAAPSKD